MTQTYRTNDPARWGTGQGFNLSPAQVDNNFWDLVQRMLAQEARPDPAAGIAYFEIVGTQMYVHMTNGAILGPYELPVATFFDRGVWQPSTAYAKMDTFSINGGLYVVTWPHTSGTSFDPGANDGAGHDYYQLMIQTPGSSLPFGGAVGQLLKKATTVDYAVMWGYTDASVVSYTPATGSDLTADNVKDALDEVQGNIVTTALEISYEPSVGGLTATTVQDALDELDTTVSGLGGSVIGKQTIWIPASSMIPLITDGPLSSFIEMSSNKNVAKTLDFDPNTNQYAQFDIAMPKSWDLGSFSFKVFWSVPSGATATDAVFTLGAVAIQHDELLDTTMSTTVSVTATMSTSFDKMCVSAESPPMAPLSAVFGNMIQFQLSRSASSSLDTLTVNARVHGIQLFYTTHTATDD